MSFSEGHPSRARAKSSSEPHDHRFATTRWTVVIEAGSCSSAGAAALEKLCRTYWHPIYAFVRRRGFDPHQAEDMTQAFFAYILEKGAFARADRAKGKFRTFLLASLTNFLSNERDKSQTLKRGGAAEIISIEAQKDEALYSEVQDNSMSPEKLFDRRWAEILVEKVLATLETEYRAAGKALLFKKIEAGLTDDVLPETYAVWGAELQMSAGAVRVALHRLRRRFGEALRSEISLTVLEPEEVDDEIRALFAAVSTR